MNHLSALWRAVTVLGMLVCVLPRAHGQRVLAITGARIETVAKAGVIEDGTIVVRDGKIVAVGKDVEIPVAAQVIEAHGKTVMPGIVDPYYVVSISRNSRASATRTIVIQGRTFVIGGGSPAIATTFAKVADALEVSQVAWEPALRSGVTSLHVVTGGYAQSLLAVGQQDSIKVEEPDGKLLVSVTNSTKSLDVLRNGLKPKGGRGAPAGGSRAAAMRMVAGRAGAERPSTAAKPGSSGSSSPPSPTEGLWTSVREGKSRVFVNVNRAAAVLHVEQIMKEHDKARVALVASGQNVYLTLEELDAERYSLILPPRIDLVPNSRYRVNIPKMLSERDVEFAFSLSLGQSDFREQQDSPLFGVAMLVRSGLDRTTALKALTLTPAKMLGIEDEVGSLEVGKRANLIVFEADPFATNAGIDQVFIDGRGPHED